MRKSSYFFLSLLTGAALLSATMIHAAHQRNIRMFELDRITEFARGLELTDLCLFTETRYSRHPSQADLNSPFQDHPTSLEHFPAGSLCPPAREHDGAQ